VADKITSLVITVFEISFPQSISAAEKAFESNMQPIARA